MKKLFILIVVCASTFTACTNKVSAPFYTDYVDVFIGTGGHGHTFPGATMPHGMVQLSPDTRQDGWDACGGYYYDDRTLMGFSHTHLSGTGIGDYGDVLFMPTVGVKPLCAGTEKTPEGSYRSHFTHETENARPGYYSVLLQDDSIRAELTATLRTGWHRYTYPDNSDARLIVDMETSVQRRRHPLTRLHVVNDSVLCGMRTVEGWAPRRHIYFYARFSSPFEAQLYKDAETMVTDVDSVSSSQAKVVLRFKQLPADRRLLVKVGISAVDEAGARCNLEAEAAGWDFDAVVRQANEAWNRELSRIEVETDDKAQQTIFYTSLYHSLVQPSVASDVDGRYRTMEQEICRDTAYTNYTVFSLWDTFRAAHPLYTLIIPQQNQAFIRSLLRKYNEQGVLPKWELASNETGTMIGYHAVSVIVDAVMKGQTGFNIAKALEACIRSSVYDTTGISPVMDRNVLHGKVMPEALRYKNELGFIPCDRVEKSVSQGLEFAYCDWLIAKLARTLGYDSIADRYELLAKNYRWYIDPETKLMRGRTSDGGWDRSFEPRAVTRSGNYVEGNAWQWSWFVPQDVEGLMAATGGPEAFVNRLDSLFTMTSELTGSVADASDVTGMIGQYAHGNEPSHHIPYLYNYAGQPHKTQTIVEQILRTQYTTAPDGLSGNEDVGQMSAWYVLSSMGIYSFCPGKPVYALGYPLFNRVTLHLEDGKTFVIRTLRTSPEQKFIRSVRLNGRPLTGYELRHEDIMRGGELEFEMEE